MNPRTPPALVALPLLIGLVLPVAAQSQSSGTVSIRGSVVDDSTGAPLPDTHVFVSGSMNGTTVDEGGRFRLDGLASGAKRVYVSRVGYTPERIDVVVPPDTTLSLTVHLEPTVVEADPITVSDQRGEEWHEHLRRFKRLFVGVSPRARRCYLLNPNTLQFDAAWWGRFEADASGPLKFENRSLGYRVTYYLKNFEERGDIVRWDGEPLFNPLSPRDSAEAARWRQNRRRAFYGSLRHFLLALLHDRVEEEQFRMYHLPRADAFRDWRRARRRPIRRSDLLTIQDDSLAEISFTGTLEIQYTGAGETDAYVEWANLHRAPRDKQVSLIRLNKRSIHMDRHGEIVEPYGATLYRYFAFRQRLANLLPRGYRPDGTSLRAVGPRR
jgi:hypothetical protein